MVLDKSDPALVKCREMLVVGEAARKTRNAIRAQINARLLSPLIASVNEAKSAMTKFSFTSGVLLEAVAEGESMIKRLQAERDGLDQALKAANSQDIKELESALANLIGLGLGLHASAATLQKMLKARQAPPPPPASADTTKHAEVFFVVLIGSFPRK